MRRRDEILLYQRDSVKAKAALYVKTDVEGRRHREQTGLDTQVVFAVNDECHRLDLYFYYNNTFLLFIIKRIPYIASRYNIFYI